VFSFANSPFDIRDDLADAYRAEWRHLASPGATMTGAERVALADHARTGAGTTMHAGLGAFVRTLYADPAAIDGALVSAAIGASSDAGVVESIGIVCRLAGVDGFHRAMGLPLEDLPQPVPGDPTGNVTGGLKRRRTHVPVGPGPIPNTLDLVPAEGAALEALHGPQYMSYDDMAFSRFARDPGLNRAQMELVSATTSIHNECFY
jgi:hypothetical protein